ncbi:tRNA-splicing endonuclease subunit Sen15 isoform X2 [Falco biarmicus]|uniref:tRNA-splicing endonuclease subunit Sen15 isoform X2 n=1 Tax=Falco rusticolus TaxID=120794 RepID=UPI0018868376|nr:tRNA-splicing endonuclease subunit Sen15 isoform X2 [Falco rusticolus]XP_055581081.1 tRNA-splicing endonuclease subunit Sen15 isoform X2 [Falco cherrug]XP_055671172.1 tRNA-splicing endonuclease subunit Sen15 isoform X2 [Falco peregrinus]XP_056211619.1 tRNA-splicing endonuclease subunit Sen15 isoform X2 [Falco biarmicus]
MEPAAGGSSPAAGTSAGGRESGGWAGGAGGNWMATHPTFTDMMSLDISDSAQIYAAFVVYLDLLEGRNWHEVKHVGVAELQLVCLHAREKEQDSLQVMVPVPVYISLSHERLGRETVTVTKENTKELLPWLTGEYRPLSESASRYGAVHAQHKMGFFGSQNISPG